jgi:hypothetical protein
MTRPATRSLHELIVAYSSHQSSANDVYDEVLREAISRVAEVGSLGKYDIGALVFWKRLQANTRWAAELLSRRDSDVRAVTAAAVVAARDPERTPSEAARSARSALTSLPGFRNGDAVASAVLVAAAPERMAVYDRRAHTGLNALGHTIGHGPGRYGRYMEVVERLRESVKAEVGLEWTARQVDLALFWLGGSRAEAPAEDE